MGRSGGGYCVCVSLHSHIGAHEINLGHKIPYANARKQMSIFNNIAPPTPNSTPPPDLRGILPPAMSACAQLSHFSIRYLFAERVNPCGRCRRHSMGVCVCVFVCRTLARVRITIEHMRARARASSRGFVSSSVFICSNNIMSAGKSTRY